MKEKEVNLFIYDPKNSDQYYRTINLTSLLDNRLSFKAKGIHCYLMTRPKNWKLIMGQLFSVSKDGEDSVRSGLKELIKHKYIHKRPARDERTRKLSGWDYFISSYPVEQVDFDQYVKGLSLGKPVLQDFSITENPAYSIKEDIKVKRKRGGVADESATSPPLDKSLVSKYRTFSEKIILKQKGNFPRLIPTREIEDRIAKSEDTLEKLERIDGFDFESEIKPVIEWAVNHEFWSEQILSLGSLRKTSRNGEKKFMNIFKQWTEDKDKSVNRKILKRDINEEGLGVLSGRLNQQPEFSI